MKGLSYQFIYVVIHVVISSHYICLISSTCALPDPIPNTLTTLSNQTLATGSHITWECRDGYMMDGLTNDAVWVCLEDGSWLGHTPICKDVACPSPPIAAYSELDPPSAEAPVVNQTISYRCISSKYTLLGSNLNRCLQDGTWENDPPICQRDCGGTTDQIKRYSDLTCYRLLGGNSTRNWSRSLETCNDNGELLATVKDAETQTFLVDFIREHIRWGVWIGAMEGRYWMWRHSGKYIERFFWQTPFPNANSKDCIELSYQDGSFSWSPKSNQTGNGLLCQYDRSCQSVGLSQSDMVLEYMDNCFQFLDVSKNCDDGAEECNGRGGFLAEILDESTNAVLLDRASHLRDINTAWWIGGYDENSGRSWYWSDKTRMNYEEWGSGEPSSNAEECLEMRRGFQYEWNDLSCYSLIQTLCQIGIPACGDPGEPLHGNRLPDDRTTYSDGATLHFTCQEGYTLSGESVLRCMTNGTWSHQRPSCEAVECEESPSNVTLSSKMILGSVYQDITLYTCQDGYVPDNEPISFCQHTGNWSTPNFTCTVLCLNTSWPSPYGIVQFPSGYLHSWSESSGECPWFTVNDGEPIARAVCSGDYISPCAWVPSDNCGGNKTADQLLIYLRENLTTGGSDIQDVLSVLTVISQDTNITSAGVGAAFDIIHQTGSIFQPTQENVASVVDIVSNLAALDQGVTMDAEMMNGAVSRATMALENILLAVEVPSNQTFQQVAANLVVQVINSESDGVRDGIVFSIIGDDSQSFDESDIQLSTNNLGKGNLGDVVQAAIIIGPETIDEGTIGNIAFTVYRDDALFVMDGGQDVQVGSNEGRRVITINTNIIGASLGTSETKPLNDPVTITLAHKQGNATNPQCVYWEYSANAWSSDGCVLTITSETHTECQCNHLTSFAVLMDVSGIPRRSERVEQVFRILSYIGCSLSILGLLVTLAVYITDRKLRCLQHIRILMCLCITLLLLYIFFIIMTALDRYPGEPEVGPVPCGVIAAVLHFTTLSSMSWMGVEGINMFLMVVRVMNSYIPLFMMKASVIAWGIPAAIVLITGTVSRQNYSNSDYCFLQKWPLVGGLLIPMAFILALNLIIFALVMRRLVRVKSGGGKASELKSEARNEITRRLTNGIGVLLLLGLTWLVGYFTVIEQLNLAVHVIFILLNSLQGFFIFVFYVLRQPQSRARLREHLVCCFHDSFSVTRSGPMSMKQTTKTGTDNPMSGNESFLSKSDID